MMRGLFEMHRRGIVHRDIQSSNVMVMQRVNHILGEFSQLYSLATLTATRLRAWLMPWCGLWSFDHWQVNVSADFIGCAAKFIDFGNARWF